MESKTDALVLRSADFNENDKIVTLLTADRGKIGAMMKGVKKVGAKLKFAAQPFCFAEYVFAEKSGRRTVISASLHEGFFSLREELASFYAGATLLKCCDAIALEGMDCSALLILAVKSLYGISSGDPAFELEKFLLGALAFSGYPVRADATCPHCGKKIAGRIRFDFSFGAFCCEECKQGVPASEITFRSVCAGLKGEEFSEGDANTRALRLLHAYFTQKTGEELSPLGEFLRLF